MRPINILLTIPNSNISGAESQLLLLSSGLKNKGYDVTICCLDGEGEVSEEAKKLNLECINIKRRFSLDVIRLVSYLIVLLSGRYKVIISFTSVANNMTRLCKVLLPFNKFIHFAGERGRDFKKKQSKELY